jgi:LmbE family N-acetylglucosaminyl deacetylase
VTLDYASAAIRNQRNETLIADLETVLIAARPETVFTHNLADRHETHLSVALHVIFAARRLPPSARPRALYGCEAWGGLDWLPGRVGFDVSARPDLSRALMAAHDSQIAGGKRYDLASEGRRRANATYREPRAPDAAALVEQAMDMTPLLRDDGLDIRDFALGLVAQFSAGVAARLAKLS